MSTNPGQHQELSGSERLHGRFLQETHRVRTRRARRTLPQLHLSTATPGRRSSSPVIVVGMHRSGTSLTSRILQSLGVDMGSDASSAHHESLSFVMRNRLLLSATNAEWDHPRPVLEALGDPGWNRTLALLLEQTIVSPRSWLLGLRQPPQTVGPSGWGWKDPRSSLTWPLWLELYPTARFVRVRRNRSDVIASVLTRSHENLRLQTDVSIRTLTEHGADSLCSEYLAALTPIDDAVEHQRVFDICYDDLLTDPHATIASLADWIGASEADVAAAVALVRTTSRPANGTNITERAVPAPNDTLGAR